jgi:glycosyltransferase involved in cell wall biosynthesis
MKIVIALASSSGQLSGVQRHGISLTRCLLTRPEITAVHLIAAPWQRDFVQDSAPVSDARFHLSTALIGNSALSRNLWYYNQLPKLATRLGANIVHLAYPVPVARRAFHCPTAVTLHDLYPYDIPQNFGFPKVLFNRMVLRRCLKLVDAITCVSQSTLSRLKKMDPELASTRARVVYNSVEQPATHRSECTPPPWGSNPFLLCVAQHRRNKNVRLALRVFAQLVRTERLAPQTRLVVVGIPGPETADIERDVTTAGLTQHVIFLNGISDALLQWCYRHCQLLLAPSSIEGFGLPIAEALLAGSRIVCSDIPAFRELGGSHCDYVALGTKEVEAFADAVVAAAGRGPGESVALPQLSAPVIADQYLQLYQSLLSSHHATPRRQEAHLLSAQEGRHVI